MTHCTLKTHLEKKKKKTENLNAFPYRSSSAENIRLGRHPKQLLECLKHAVLFETHQATFQSISEVVLFSASSSPELGKQTARLELPWPCQRARSSRKGHLRGDTEQWTDDLRHPHDLLLCENGPVTRRLLLHTLCTLCP